MLKTRFFFEFETTSNLSKSSWRLLDFKGVVFLRFELFVRIRSGSREESTSLSVRYECIRRSAKMNFQSLSDGKPGRTFRSGCVFLSEQTH